MTTMRTRPGLGIEACPARAKSVELGTQTYKFVVLLKPIVDDELVLFAKVQLFVDDGEVSPIGPL